MNDVFWLAQHVHLCASGASVILLDCVANKYFHIPKIVAASIAPQVIGWPDARSLGVDPAKATVLADQCLSDLHSKGLLTRDERSGKPATPVSFAEPRPAALSRHAVEDPVISMRDVFRVARAFMKASAWRVALNRQQRTLEHIVSHVRERNVQPARELGDIPRLVRIFERVRPVFSRPRDACFYQSLALHYFLGFYGAHPQWVWAVQDAPFVAHCWLQVGDVPLNDPDEYCLGLTPIMVA
jgi:hypothetical protein